MVAIKVAIKSKRDVSNRNQQSTDKSTTAQQYQELHARIAAKYGEWQKNSTGRNDNVVNAHEFRKGSRILSLDDLRKLEAKLEEQETDDRSLYEKLGQYV
jgi:hypothetical protein